MLVPEPQLSKSSSSCKTQMKCYLPYWAPMGLSHNLHHSTSSVISAFYVCVYLFTWAFSMKVVSLSVSVFPKPRIWLGFQEMSSLLKVILPGLKVWPHVATNKLFHYVVSLSSFQFAKTVKILTLQLLLPRNLSLWLHAAVFLPVPFFFPSPSPASCLHYTYHLARFSFAFAVCSVYCVSLWETLSSVRPCLIHCTRPISDTLASAQKKNPAWRNTCMHTCIC